MSIEKRIRNKTLLIVASLLIAISATYLYFDIRHQNRLKEEQIQKEIEAVFSEVRSLLNTTRVNLLDKIHFFTNDEDIITAFLAKQPDKLYKEAYPFFSVLSSEYPYHFSIGFISAEGSSLLTLHSNDDQRNITLADSRVAQKALTLRRMQSDFEMLQGELAFSVVRPYFSNNKFRGCIVFSLRDQEIIAQLREKHHTEIISVFDKRFFIKGLTDSLSSCPENDYFLYKSNIQDSTYIREWMNLSSDQTVSANIGNHQVLLKKLNIQNTLRDEGLISLIIQKDITAFEKKFEAYILQVVVIILLLIFSVCAALYISFNKLLTKFFDLQKSLDRKLEEKTREIIDTNTELNQIFHTTANSLRLISKEFTVLRVNETFSKLSGIPIEEAQGKKCYEVFPGARCHTADCPITQIKNGARRVEVDAAKRTGGGKTIHGLLTTVPFMGSNKEFVGVIEDFKDITERKRYEEALKRSERQFSFFMNNLPLGVYIKDENSILEYMNQFTHKRFGKPNCLGKHPRQIFEERFAHRIEREDQQVLAGKNIVVEEEIPGQDGTINIYQTHKFRFLGVDKQWKIGGICLEITEKKRNEQRLKVLSNAIQHSPACVVITNTQGIIEFVNPRFTEITGYQEEEVSGKNIAILRSNQLEAHKLHTIIAHVTTGRDWQGEIKSKTKKGHTYYELASISAVKDEKGHPTHFVMISEDISHRKRYEKDLKEAKNKAEEADRLKSAFLANLSHEIRTPMNAIIGFTNVLMDEELPGDEKQKLKTLIHDNSFSLLKLIDEIIELSKIQAGNIRINNTVCYVNRFMKDLYANFKTVIAEKDKDIRLSCVYNVMPNDFAIIVDEIKVRQVLNSLIDNAIKFTSKGFVEFGYAVKEEVIQFHVIDSGSGIAEDQFGMIYDLFRQADDSFTRAHGGAGIGLSISKKLIEHLGGKIWAQSTPNQGTNIYFTLPLEVPHPKFNTHQLPEQKEYNWQDKVVLVAEDIDSNYLFIQEALSITNAKVLWAKNGKEAVQMIKKFPNVDLVLMDIKMPEMDGFEATRQIKSMRNVKIIGQTAYAHDQEKQKCTDAGFDEYFSKPITINHLLHSIEQAFTKN
ncbi:MAG: PAS domain S-box protein [Bacteroidota bacterium]